MPYRLDWENEGVSLVYSGDVSEDDIIESNLEIYDDQRFENIRYQIVDMLNASSIAFTENAMHQVSDLDAKAASWNPGVRVAIVSASGQIDRLVRVYGNNMTDSPWETATFDGYEAARAWLDA